MNRRHFLMHSAALMATLSACGRNRPQRLLPSDSRVLALGDSLTEGYGAPSGADYPKQLANITHWRIQNAGVSGQTSAQVRARLSQELQTKPQLVLLCVGGNDFLRKLPTDTTYANISHMLHACAAAHAPVVLVAVPRVSASALLGHLEDHPIYAQLAKQHRVPLLAEVWSDILSTRKLKSDAVHANAQGYRLFAEKMAKFLKKQGYLA